MATIKAVAVDEIPAGFRSNGSGSGLIVPEEVSRKREVITAEEWKKVTAAVMHVCRPHNMRFMWICNNPKCPDPRFVRIRRACGFVLRCGCRDIINDPEL